MKRSVFNLTTDLALAAVVLCGVAGLYAAEKSVVKAAKLNPWQTVVSCVSGEQPDVARFDGAVVISCPGRLQSK